MRNLVFGVLCVSLIMVEMSSANAQVPMHECGQLKEGHGPFDYRTQKHELEVVERFHFTPAVESLRSGSTGVNPGGDLDYTLRASPNHHRALVAMMNLSRKEKKVKPSGAHYSMECWFDRAERFAPNDGMVKVLHGIYLIRANKSSAAIDILEKAKVLEPRNANLQYNLGLAYFEIGKYNEALESAQIAYGLGFPLPGLRNKLQAKGKWHDR